MKHITISPIHHPERPVCRVCGHKFEYGESADVYHCGNKTKYQCSRCNGKTVLVYPLKMTGRK